MNLWIWIQKTKWDKFDVIIENWTVKNCFDSYWNSASKNKYFIYKKPLITTILKDFQKINIKN